MMTLLQAGAIPYRLGRSGREFLLVTSSSGKWIFPKGIVEPEDTPEKTAVKEAMEEAGIIGRLLPGELGVYGDTKWQSRCRVVMYLLEYCGESDSWEDSGIRRRKWTTYDEALRLLRKPELKLILEKAWERLEVIQEEPPPPGGSCS